MRIGVDLGGTKIEALALDPKGREVFRKRVLTPRGDYAATLEAVVALVKEVGPGSVGVGIPGALSRVTGLVKNANSTWLIGRPLKQDLEREHEHLTQEKLAAREIAALDGEALDRYIQRLARALAGVINLLDPDVIVLGGGMSNIERLYAEVPRRWLRHVFSDHVATRLVRNVHGDSSGVRGAAWLW